MTVCVVGTVCNHAILCRSIEQGMVLTTLHGRYVVIAECLDGDHAKWDRESMVTWENLNQTVLYQFPQPMGKLAQLENGTTKRKQKFTTNSTVGEKDGSNWKTEKEKQKLEINTMAVSIPSPVPCLLSQNSIVLGHLRVMAEPLKQVCGSRFTHTNNMEVR